MAGDGGLKAGGVRTPGADLLDGFFQDARLGLRRLVRRPGFSLIAVGMLTFGLSASTAVYTYINAFSQPFPGATATDVLRVHRVTADAPFGNLSYPDYLDLVGFDTGSFDGVEAVSYSFGASARHEDLAEIIFGEAVTGGFFAMLGIEMHRGRGLTPADDQPGAPPAVVISYAYSVERFGGSDDAVGRTFILNGNPYTIVGVASPEFVGTSSDLRPEVWFPFEQYKLVYWPRSERETSRESSVILPFVRPAPGVSLHRANSALASFAAGVDGMAPLEDGPRHLTLDRATWVDPESRLAEMPTARIMLSAAAGLLLLACGNVANLMLAMGNRREREVAMRAAIGASRGRLLRQLLTESLLLGLTAGVVSFALAGPASRWIGSFFASPSVWGANVPRVVSLDPKVFAFALIAAVGTGVLAGILPAFRASRRSLVGSLRKSPGSSNPSRVLGLDDLLVSAQIALSLTLLVVAGLVLRTLDSAQRVDAGFKTESVLASYLTTSSIGTPIEERHQFYRELAQRLEALPWVKGVTVTDNAPLSGHAVVEVRAYEGGRTVPVTFAKVFPGYFDLLDVDVVAGRAFEPTDTGAVASVAIINETMAERLYGNENPLGRELTWSGARVEGEQTSEIVGVVRDTRLVTLLGEPESQLYVSYPQVYSTPGNAVLVSTNIDPAAAVPRLEAVFRAVDARLAVVNVVPYSDVLRGFLYKQRMNAQLFGIVAALALVLASVGIFGVMNLAVGMRTREIGIRMAIGAASPDIARLIVRRVGIAVGLGMALGLVGALMATRWTESLLFGVESMDPLSFVAASLTLAGATAAAALIPTLRALAVDPITSLRIE